MSGYNFLLIIIGNDDRFPKSKLPGEAASARLQLLMAPRPDRSPAHHDDRAANPNGPAHRQWPRAAAGTRAPAAITVERLPGAASGSPQESASCGLQELLLKSLCASFVSFVRFVVWSVVAGYNYQLIVIANRRCCFSNPAPGKFPSPKAGTTWLSGPTRCGQEHKTNQVRHFSKHCSFSSLPHLFKCAVPNIRRISDIEIERRSNESICGSERENIAFAQAIR